MKPHSMFFDESYSEHYYRYDTVNKFVENADCLIVVGTALQTHFASAIVKNLLIKHDAPVIEINLESSVNRGYNLQVKEKSDTALPALFNEYYRLMQETRTENIN